MIATAQGGMAGGDWHASGKLDVSEYVLMGSSTRIVNAPKV